MQAKILAFDTGTANTGWSTILCSTYPCIHAVLTHHGMITTKKSFGSVRERIDHIGNRVKELIEVVHPTHIAIEDFTEQGKFVGTTYKEMAWLTEHFRMIGREVGIEVTLYENGVWKKKLMGASRVNKNQVQHFISHALPNSADHLKGRPDHVWDSVGVGLCKWKELNGL